MTQANEKRNESALLWRRAALLPVVVLLLFLLARWLGLGSGLGDLRGWIEVHGLAGGLVFVLVYTLVGASGLPGLPMTLAAGVLFGSLKGVILVSLGTASGAAFAFVLARTLAREAVRRWLSGKEAFERLERWTADRGPVVVLLTRLFPIFPYSLLNYSFGLTRVRFWTYLLWTWIGMLPGHVVYVTGMDAISRGLAGEGVSWELVLIGGLALLLLIGLVPWARRQLRRSSDGN